MENEYQYLSNRWRAWHLYMACRDKPEETLVTMLNTMFGEGTARGWIRWLKTQGEPA